ncbi:MAG: homoaconitate hydratase [Candidatus Thermoplasmatota archaeon]|nr:homoaconitate hydratase [Candidatus Thermoplasmatota archaeon]
MEERLVRNYLVEEKLVSGLPEKLYFWDETLRDGEQMPGVHFTPDEKLRIARMMDDIGIAIMDVGMPIISQEEKRAVKAIATAGLDAQVISAARTLKGDIDACLDCDVDEVSIFVACSDLHLKYKLRMTREQVLSIAPEMVEYTKEHGVKVSFVTEDTVRADMDYVEELYNACIAAGADRAVLCDTVGVMTPTAMKWWLTEVRKRLRPIQLSVHIHNDFGMGVANTLAALECGVEVPHTTINGLGERSGNTPFEETVTALESLYGYETGINISRLYKLSRLVEELSGVPVAVNKPIVGYNAFRHESGIHTHGVLMHTLTYEPIQPELVGNRRVFIFGKHTGAAAVEDRLKGVGIKADKEKVMDIVASIKELTERKEKEDQRAFIRSYREREEKLRGVTEEEFWRIAEKVGLELPPSES